LATCRHVRSTIPVFSQPRYDVSDLQATAHLMQTRTFKSPHFDEAVNVLHNDLAICQALWSLSKESRWHNFQDYCTAKGRDSRRGSSIISQIYFSLGTPLGLCLSFVNNGFGVTILRIWLPSRGRGFCLELCHQILLNR
jgi:hypothetical protein